MRGIRGRAEAAAVAARNERRLSDTFIAVIL
jgi:hypothetical protein